MAEEGERGRADGDDAAGRDVDHHFHARRVAHVLEHAPRAQCRLGRDGAAREVLEAQRSRRTRSPRGPSPGNALPARDCAREGADALHAEFGVRRHHTIRSPPCRTRLAPTPPPYPPPQPPASSPPPSPLP